MISKISSILAFKILKIKSSLIFLNFESIKKLFFNKLFSSKSFLLFLNEKSVLSLIAKDSSKFKEQTFEISFVI